LIRSSDATRGVRKSAAGSSHGYSSQEFVGSLPADALKIPADLAAKPSPQEIAYVENKVVLPNDLRAAPHADINAPH
jgi:hypothetical protein